MLVNPHCTLHAPTELTGEDKEESKRYAYHHGNRPKAYNLENKFKNSKKGKLILKISNSLIGDMCIGTQIHSI